MTFERRFTDIEELKKTPLFQNCLRPDITETFSERTDRGRDVFPAVRKGRMDFYHKGGKLFSFSRAAGFITHHKYASVIRSEEGKDYVTDANLQAVRNFEEGYERIKENCSLYSGVEAQGVSQVYGRYSCAKLCASAGVVVLDIEISLKQGKEAEELVVASPLKTNSDRIDLLLLDTDTGLLRFFEAKDFSNNEIRAMEGHHPRIVKQMHRYEKQLNTQHVREEMLAGYAAHIEAINELFELEVPLPCPKDIDPVPRLLLFGFDASQLKGKLDDEANRLENEYGLSVYPKGDIKSVNPQALFSGGRKHWAVST